MLDTEGSEAMMKNQENDEEGRVILDGPFADWTGIIVGAAIEVQKQMGPGLLESAYEACLSHELQLRGHRIQRQVALLLNCGVFPLGKKGIRRFVGPSVSNLSPSVSF